MKTLQPEPCVSTSNVTAYYEDRYASGYMDEWPVEKKARVFELIRSLGLPETGAALDFGCGNGVFTDVIKQALPGWEVSGCDISATAIANARARYPACQFFAVAARYLVAEFDFIFTHHTLEHVEDLTATLVAIDALLKPTSSVLHILPCGNGGSLEWSIARARYGGIDPKRGNRFWYEDPGHVRRLKSTELRWAYQHLGFGLITERFANQKDGAINWITRSGFRFIRTLTDGSQSISCASVPWLAMLRWKLLILTALRLPAVAFQGKLAKRQKSAKDVALLVAGFPFYLLSLPVDLWLKRKAATEWRMKSQDRSGSEMYLYFKRNG